MIAAYDRAAFKPVDQIRLYAISFLRKGELKEGS
jgi:hypothetical protein